MARLAIFGAGRIAEVHARGALLAGAEVAGIFDIREEAAAMLAQRFSTKVIASAEAALQDPSIDIIAVATSTDTHADYIVSCAKAGKAIFCEKPIDLSVARAEACQREIAGLNAFIQIGFNRRFDPSFAKIATAVREETIGRIENLTIISRDPAPASIEYFKVSGGLFKDMAIHDFDMARYILPEEPVAVFATGSVLVSEEIGAIGDVDSTTVVMRTASGIQCQILNSRHCAYGYDQRVEAFGSEGAIHANNPHIDHTTTFSANVTDCRPRLPDFFLERYTESYNLQWRAILEALSTNGQPQVSFDDGLKALQLAEAANESMKTGALVRLG